MPLSIIRQDITKIECDVIVNPTNTKLSPDGGLDLAIHKAAGDELKAALISFGEIKTSEVIFTSGYNLPAKHIIHTSSPLWSGGDNNEEFLLRTCYINCLKLAKEMELESIAFPLISSGAYGYPKDKVLKIAIDTISDFLFESDMMVWLVVFDKKAFELSGKLFNSIEAFIDDNYCETVSLDFLGSRHREVKCEHRRRAFASMPEPSVASFRAAECADDSICESKSLDIDEYIKLDESFTLKLLKLIDAKEMTDVECYKKANVSKQTWYKIMNDKNYRPNKKTVISFAVALRLTLSETQSLLESVGFILSNSSLFDVIIMYCLKNCIYDVLEIDSILFKYDQETLYSKL